MKRFFSRSNSLALTVGDVLENARHQKRAGAQLDFFCMSSINWDAGRHVWVMLAN
jgi:hypothetical protein